MVRRVRVANVIDVIDARNCVVEEMLPAIKDAVIAADNKTKVSEASGLATLCREYDVKLLGSIYNNGKMTKNTE